MAVSLNVTLPGLDPVHPERQSFRLTALDRYREPLAGAAVTVTLVVPFGVLEADGARGPQVEIVTDATGEAAFQWFPPDQAVESQGQGVRVVVATDSPHAIDLTVESVIEVFWI